MMELLTNDGEHHGIDDVGWLMMMMATIGVKTGGSRVGGPELCVPCLLLPSALDAQFGTPYPRSDGFDIDNFAMLNACH